MDTTRNTNTRISSPELNPLSAAAAYLKDILADPGIIHALGFGRDATPTAKGQMISCPFHPRRSGTPSCHVYREGSRLVAYCHGECEHGYDVLSLVAASHNLGTKGPDFGRVLEEGARLAGFGTLGDLLRHLGVDSTPKPGRRPGAAVASPAVRATAIEGATDVSSHWAVATEHAAQPSWEEQQREIDAARAVADLRSLARYFEPVSERAVDERGKAVYGWLGYNRGFCDGAAKVGTERLGWVLPWLPTDKRPPSTRGWWASGHYYVTLLYDSAGDIVSARARCVRPGCDPKRRSLSPADCRVTVGAVFANVLGRALLRGGPAAWAACPPTVVVAEGEMDFAAVSVSVPEDVIVFGVVSGSWSDALAARIPVGSRVVILTHSDKKGVAYLTKIATSLPATCQIWARNPEVVYRLNSDGSFVLDAKGRQIDVKEADENDRLKMQGWGSYDPLNWSQLAEIEVA